MPLKQTATIVFPSNHGIGDELTLVGPLLSSLIEAGYASCLWTFHPQLYAHETIRVVDWTTIPHNYFIVTPSDLGFYLPASLHNLPIQYDRSTLVSDTCKQSNWIMLDPDSWFAARSETVSPYAYTQAICDTLGLPKSQPPWAFLPQISDDYVVINLFGYGDARKGPPPQSVWELIEQITEYLPLISFVVVYLNDSGHPLPDQALYRRSNLRIVTVTFNSPEATLLYCGARLIVTAEGGGYHLAYGACIRSLLVTSFQWFDLTRTYALPPLAHETILFDATAHPRFECYEVAYNIAKWISANY